MAKEMQIFKAAVDYDPQFDLLSVRRPKEKTSYNLVAGNMIFDFYKHELIGFEVQDAKQWLSDVFEKVLPNFTPLDIQSAKIGMKEKKSLMQMVIMFEINNQTLTKEFLLPKFNPAPIIIN